MLHPRPGTRVICLLLLLAPSLASGQQTLDYESPPIRYSSTTPDNKLSRLNRDLASGRARLGHDDTLGYLPALLKTLEVPPSSQVLQFAKTSLQRHRIGPSNPRAIYFSDDIFVGFVREQPGHGEPPVLELAITDPALGVVFYTLSQAKAETPRLNREANRCLTCHGGSQSRGVPGVMVRSVFPDLTGQPVVAAGKYLSTHQSPLSQRWGGWYVTGTHGEQKHLGNFTLPNSKKPRSIDNSAGQNVEDLSSRVSLQGYLSPHSDLVALMVLEHQADAVNYLNRLRYLTYATKPDADASREAVEEVVNHLLFANEHRLTAPVQGTSAFTKEFSARGPVDRAGRSLRQFDLKTRMFRHPLSYMIYSQAFDTLPKYAREQVYRRLWEVLTTTRPASKSLHLAVSDRQALREILRDTRPDLPEYWRKEPARLTEPPGTP